MEYNQITKFLEKFKKILFQKEEIHKIVVETISKHLSFELESNQIKIKNTFIYIEGSPILKNEVLIHKKEILLELKEKIPQYNLIDIK